MLCVDFRGGRANADFRALAQELGSEWTLVETVPLDIASLGDHLLEPEQAAAVYQQAVSERYTILSCAFAGYCPARHFRTRSSFKRANAAGYDPLAVFFDGSSVTQEDVSSSVQEILVTLGSTKPVQASGTRQEQYGCSFRLTRPGNR